MWKIQIIKIHNETKCKMFYASKSASMPYHIIYVTSKAIQHCPIAENWCHVAPGRRMGLGGVLHAMDSGELSDGPVQRLHHGLHNPGLDDQLCSLLPLWTGH